MVPIARCSKRNGANSLMAVQRTHLIDRQVVGTKEFFDGRSEVADVQQAPPRSVI